MAAILLEPPTTTSTPTTMPTENDDHEARDMSCPVCGSGSTYQIMGGRWGCTSCGATWA